jgi:hypothetical protein
VLELTTNPRNWTRFRRIDTRQVRSFAVPVFFFAGDMMGILPRHQARVVAMRLELPAEVMRPNARLHADEVGRHVREPSLDLAA